MLMLLYDEDCGFCRATLALLLRWDRHARLCPEPIQSQLGARLLAGVPGGERLEAAHIVTTEGRVVSGGDAAAVIARELPGGAPVARLATLLGGPTRAGYRWVARHRTLLSHLFSARAERLATAAIARHRARALGTLMVRASADELPADLAEHFR